MSDLRVEIDSSFEGSGFEDLSDQQQQAAAQSEAAAQKIGNAFEENLKKAAGFVTKLNLAVQGTVTGALLAASTNDQAWSSVRTQIDLSGKSFANFRSEIEQNVSALDRASRFTENEVVRSFSQLIATTDDIRASLITSSLAVDLAVTFNKSLEESTRMVSSAISGEVGSLGDLVPEIRSAVTALGQNSTASQRAAVMLQILSRFSGAAAKDSSNFAGKVSEGKDSVLRLAVAVGQSLMPPLVAFLSVAIPIVDKIAAFAREHQTLTAVVVGSAAGLTALAGLFIFIGLTASGASVAIGGLKVALDTLKAHPVILIASALATLAAIAIPFFIDSEDAAADSQKQIESYTSGFKSMMDEINSGQAGIGDFIKNLNGAAESTTALATAAKSIDTTALRDLMNQGLSFAEAMNLMRGAVAEPVEIVVEYKSQGGGMSGRIAQWKAMADMLNAIEKEGLQKGVEAHSLAEIMRTSVSAEQMRARIDIWAIERDNALMMMQPMIAGYQTMITSFSDAEMTGAERIKAVRSSVLSAGLRMVSQLTSEWIFGAIARAHADQAAAVSSQSAAGKVVATEMAASVKVIGQWLKVAASKVVSFYSALGPFAIPAAAGTIAAIYGLIRGLRFHEGGVVPRVQGREVMATLQSGEIVVQPNIPREQNSGLKALSDLGLLNNSTPSIQQSFTFNAPASKADMLDMLGMGERSLRATLLRMHRQGDLSFLGGGK